MTLREIQLGMDMATDIVTEAMDIIITDISKMKARRSGKSLSKPSRDGFLRNKPTD